jgi:glycolate oxidase FAD binding subunit
MLAASQAEPSAVELDWPGGEAPITLAVLVEGSAAGQRAEALRAAMGAGTVTDEAPAWWGLIADDELLIELRFPPARTSEVLAAVRDTGLSLRGSPVAGRVWLQPGAEPPAEFAGVVSGLRERLTPLGGRVTVLAAPYEGVDRWGPVSALPLMRRVKERFDPDRQMSPGRFIGGI